MAIPLSINGQVFEYPENFDEGWGIDATGWAQAVTNGMLQRSGGNFPLTADANFGASFGLVSSYYKSHAANISSTGVVRLAKTDALAWRNNANSGDLPLAINGSDQLTFNGVAIAPGTVTSITGTVHQIIASASVGAVTLSTPQNIDTTSSPTFASLTLSSPLTAANGGTGVTSLGNLTDAGTDGIVITGGTGATIVSASIAQHVSDTSHNGYLLSTDWNTFNSKQATLSGTANEIIITGTVLSTPQPIGTASSPTFLNETLTGILSTGDGSASAPSHSFTFIPTSGLYNDIGPIVNAPAADWNTSTHQVNVANSYTTFDIWRPVQLTTTGTLPAGLALATTYYLINFVLTGSQNLFSLAATVGGGAIAFTTQGTGTHTISPATTGAMGVANNGVRTATFTSDNRLGIGGQPDFENTNEMLHVERSTTPSSISSVDSVVVNTGTSGARLLVQSNPQLAGGAPSVVSYLGVFGPADPGNWWSAGPAISASNFIEFQNGSSTVFALTGTSGGANTTCYFWNGATTGDFQFLTGTPAVLTMDVNNDSVALGSNISFYPSRITTTQRLALSVVAGAMVYDTTLNHPFYYNGSTWVQI